MNCKLKILFSLIVFVKVMVPIILLPLLAHMLQHTYDIANNPDFYGNIASNLSNGLGYRIFPETTITMLREPGYIIILAIIFHLFGEGYVLPQLFNVIFSLVAAFFLFKIGKEFKISRNTMLLVLVLFLLHPAFLLAESRLGVEVFYSMLLVCTIYFMLIAEKRKTILSFILAGFFSAATALTRSTVIPFIVGWLIYMLFVFLKKRLLGKKWVNLSTFVLSFCLLFSLWPIRNYFLSHSVVITATVSGDSLFQGMYVNKHWTRGKPYYKTLDESTFEQKRILRNVGLVPQYADFFYLYSNINDELRHSSIMKDTVLSEYKNDPFLLISTMVRNSFAFWTRGGTNISTTLNTILNIPILTLSIMGIILQIRKREYMIPILLLISFIYFVHLPILSTARHHVPLVPFLMMFSGISISCIYQNRMKIINKK